MENTITSKAKYNLKVKALNAERTADYNLTKALEIPEICTLFNKCKGLIFEIGKQQYYKQNVKALENEFVQTKALLQKELDNHNIDSNTLKPQYSCQKCKDTGYVGKAECDCLKKEISRLLLLSCGIGLDDLPSFDKVDFEIFGKQKDNAKQIYKVCNEYCDKLDTTKKKFAVLTGLVGVGKTYLLQCVVNKCIQGGHYVLYTTAFNLNQDMLRYHLANINDKNDILDKYMDCELLCIDDLGTENHINNVTNEYLYLILNERLSKNKNTIITTNLNFEQIQDNYDERIFSRLLCDANCLKINIVGEDLRLTKRNKK